MKNIYGHISFHGKYSEQTSRKYTHQIKLLSFSSWLRQALKSFKSVNSILLTKSVTYQGKDLLPYSVVHVLMFL